MHVQYFHSCRDTPAAVSRSSHLEPRRARALRPAPSSRPSPPPQDNPRSTTLRLVACHRPSPEPTDLQAGRLRPDARFGPHAIRSRVSPPHFRHLERARLPARPGLLRRKASARAYVFSENRYSCEDARNWSASQHLAIRNAKHMPKPGRGQLSVPGHPCGSVAVAKSLVLPQTRFAMIAGQPACSLVSNSSLRVDPDQVRRRRSGDEF